MFLFNLRKNQTVCPVLCHIFVYNKTALFKTVHVCYRFRPDLHLLFHIELAL